MVLDACHSRLTVRAQKTSMGMSHVLQKSYEQPLQSSYSEVERGMRRKITGYFNKVQALDLRPYVSKKKKRLTDLG